jgi:hypothetical protein
VYRQHQPVCCSPPSQSCPVGAHILPVLREATALAVEALEEELPRTKIADIASSVLARSNEAERAKRNQGESAWRQLTLRN